jgi:hypothetical protein
MLIVIEDPYLLCKYEDNALINIFPGMTFILSFTSLQIRSNVCEHSLVISELSFPLLIFLS